MTDLKKFDYNAEVVVKTACHVKPGETLLILTEEKNNSLANHIRT